MTSSSQDNSNHDQSKPKWTPGPWKWFGQGNCDNLYLATIHSGRRYVMGFARWGMQGAQPLFQVNGRMIPASEMLKFEVGSGEARGIKEGKEDQSVYRYDVSSIDHPDAHLIASAPELYEALEQCRSELKSILLQYDNTTPSFGLELANKALAKARGEDQ